MKKLNVLIACEFSGVVREAFKKNGHNAWSCDLEETEIVGNHLIGNVLNFINFRKWDLVIAHPPCTHIAVSGACRFKEKIADGRQQAGIDFFMRMINLPIKKIAVENPVCIMSRLYRKPDQIIQPFEFGHPESKKTCLWLKNLPQLKPTCILKLPKIGYWENQTPSHQNKLGGKKAGKQRSRTYLGIAEAMANQWGNTNEI